MKYRPEFPDRFGCIQDSRAFCQQFFKWYNEEHRHSGIAMLAPAVVHFGEAQVALDQRQAVLDAAYRAHPDRFVRQSSNCRHSAAISEQSHGERLKSPG